MCGSLFLFACGERVRVVSRGVSDTCHVSHVSPWVTTPPCPMWESLICGRQHQYMGVSDKWDRVEYSYYQVSCIIHIIIL